MAVDRRHVEVRPELRDRVLRVAPHEHLAAEPDDRLVGGAVAVVLEPPAVQPTIRWVCEAGQKMWLAKKPSP